MISDQDIYCRRATQFVGIVFSKDRPLQLDGALRSLFMHCRDVDNILLKVLYTTSSSFQQSLYQNLADQYLSVEFVQEKSFKSDLLSLLDGFAYVLFMVDDNIFVRDFSLCEITSSLSSHLDTLGFSLRLGRNTTYCYMLDKTQHLPDFQMLQPGVLKYDWTVAEHDFGYPVEVSSSVYRCGDLMPLLAQMDFNNPNSLEGYLAANVSFYKTNFRHLLCYDQSVAFCAPVNKVQTFNDNRAGVETGYSANALAGLYGEGYRLDVAAYSGFVPHSCHQEVELNLEKYISRKTTVSVIIPCYNQACFLEEAVTSVVAQSFNDWECIIVNDGSPDDTSDVTRKLTAAYPDKIIRLVEKDNGGLASARNAGICTASGKYILPLDADDKLHPDFLSETVAILESSADYAIVYVDEQNFGNASHVHCKGISDLKTLMFANVHDYCSLYRREVWRTVGGYSPAMYLGGEDWNFWVCAASHGFQSFRLPLPLFHYRNRENTMVAETLANIQEVWAHVVFHHLNLYDANQKKQARTILEHVPPENREKLEKTLQKHCANTLLNLFSTLAEGIAHTVKPLSAQPLVTVVVPTKDRPELLKHALSSIVAQDYPNWEAIVVNDGGKDVEALIQSLDPSGRIRYLTHRSNFGLPVARNTALRLAVGEIVCYLDDDDMFLPQHLSTVVDTMRRTSSAFVYTDAEYVGEKLEHGERREVGRARPYANIQYSKERLHIENFIPVNTWGHRWDNLLKTGFFDESLPALEDWELLLRFSKHFDFVHVPKVTVEVRQRIAADNMSRQERPGYADLFRKIYQKHNDLGSDTVRHFRKLSLEKLDSERMAAKQEEDKVLGLEERGRLEYQAWIHKHSLQEIDGQLLAERMVLKWTSRPVIHFVMHLHAGEEELLADTLDSLGMQMYPEWRLSVIAAFAPPSPVFSEFEMLQWIEVNQTVDIPETINQMVNVMAADWLGFIPAGIRFTPQYLITCADYINIRPQWRLIYTDEDVIDREGKRSDPKFKPDMNLDMLRSSPYFGSFLLRRDTFAEMGGYSRIAGLESYDLALRALDTADESAMGHIADVLFHMPAQIPVEPDKGALKRVLAEHLHRNGIAGEVVEGYQLGTCRVIYQHTGKPLVSIIIPTRDKLEFIQPCIESLFEMTDYPNFEVLLVDNQSDDPDVLEFYQDAKLQYGGRLRVLMYPREFNFSAINNYAVEHALGEYLLLLNNDTQIVQAEWLSRMMAYGQRPEVGAVGARLVYPETGKLQHAGIVLGMTRVADHQFNGILSINEPGYMNRAQIDQNYSAVTAACLLARKSLYQSVGGMDEEKLKVLFNDVDLCLKVGQSGYKIVWTPYATVVHHNSTSLKGSAQDLMQMALAEDRGKKEHEAMFERWMPKLSNDPAYNKNLSLARQDYTVEGTVVIDWDTNFHDRPRILGMPLSGASGEYRMIGPFRALGYAGLAQTNAILASKMFKTRVLQPAELDRAKPDSFVLHAAIDDMQIEALSSYKQFNSGVLRIFTLDDLLTQPPKKSSFYKYSYKDAKPRLRKALSLSDRLIVTTQPLADLCKGMIDDIRVIPNRLERVKWGDVSTLRMQGKKPRVGWAGAQQHEGDLELIHEVVKATAHEVDWIFFGMCPNELRPHVREFHDFILSFEDYPSKLASLNLDLAVAPLEINAFNEAKSNLRLLEYGIMGWPVVCTDISSYHGAPVKHVSNQAQAWTEAIRERIHDLDAAYKEGDQLRQWVLNHYILEDHLDEWLAALLRS